jgi:hypothetical protein
MMEALGLPRWAASKGTTSADDDATRECEDLMIRRNLELLQGAERLNELERCEGSTSEALDLLMAGRWGRVRLAAGTRCARASRRLSQVPASRAFAPASAVTTSRVRIGG